ncbi:MAG: hypothetical protein ACRDRD_18660 [Pseudonocardiaceae bacterium]
MKLTASHSVTRHIPQPGRRQDGRFLRAQQWERTVRRDGVDVTECRELRWLFGEDIEEESSRQHMLDLRAFAILVAALVGLHFVLPGVVQLILGASCAVLAGLYWKAPLVEDEL